MTMWAEYRRQIDNVLDQLTVITGDGESLSAEEGFAKWTAMTHALRSDHYLYMIGNGASASMASHFSADIAKNCGVRAGVFTDCALITALGNDNGFENAYAFALGRFARPGDLLVAISSSGNSPNLINACRAARRLRLGVVTLSGKNPDNALRKMGDLNFHVPGGTYSLSESAHAAILHHWTDRLENMTKGRA